MIEFDEVYCQISEGEKLISVTYAPDSKIMIDTASLIDILPY
jgi:hypothetical protein